MNHTALQSMTVAQLREFCGRLGLPKFQAKGKRLGKPDLIAQLLDHESTTYRIADPPAPRKPSAPRRTPIRLTDDDRIVRQLAAMPADLEETKAVYRFLQGTHKPKDDGVLRRREARAAMELRDKADAGSRTWKKWHRRYLDLTGVVS